MTNVLIIAKGLLPYDAQVIESFTAGYGGAFKGKLESVIGSFGNAMQHAQDKEFDIIISPYFSFDSELAKEKYPTIQVFQSVQSRPVSVVDNLTEIIFCGAGTASNDTGYKVEFFNEDTVVSGVPGMATAQIAGKIAYIKDQLGCGIWEARERARLTASLGYGNYTAVNGYGIIDVGDAISFDGVIREDEFAVTDVDLNLTTKKNGEIVADIIGGLKAESYEVFVDKVEAYSGLATQVTLNLERRESPYLIEVEAENHFSTKTASKNFGHLKFPGILITDENE